MDETARPRRSVLYLPASNGGFIDKGRALDVDGLVLDLEDAVMPAEKARARALAVEAVLKGGFGPREVVIRVNGPLTQEGPEDLAAAARAGPDAVLVPKIRTREDVEAADRALSAGGAPARTRLWAMMEMPSALLAAEAIAASARSTRLAALVIGANDISKELRLKAHRDRLGMLTALSLVVMAGRAHGLALLDGVYNDTRDAEGFERECVKGRMLGFDGKTLIHPGQIAAANRVFAPDEADIAAARKVIAAFALPENRGRGAIALEGRMVEALHLAEARPLLARAEAIAAREGRRP